MISNLEALRTQIGDQELLEMSKLRHFRPFQLLLEGIEASLDTQLQEIEALETESNEVVVRKLAEWKAGRRIYAHLKNTPEIFGQNLLHFGNPAAMVQAHKELEEFSDGDDLEAALDKLSAFGVE